MAARIHRFLDRNTYSSSKLIHVVESKYFTLFLVATIISNTFLMILETYDSYYKKFHSFFLISEKIYLCIYIIECCFKLWVYSWRFFKTLWNCFDLFIIIINIIDFIIQELTHDHSHTSLQIDHNQHLHTQFEQINHFFKILRVLRVLRSFRALRVLRTIRFIQSIHIIVKTCSKALPAMASIIFIMIIITCISAIVARSLFGDVCPEKFSNLVKTFFSLFTLLTLDDWYSVYQVCAERDYSNFQLAFCLIYIFIINFILLNLLMAVLGKFKAIYLLFYCVEQKVRGHLQKLLDGIEVLAHPAYSPDLAPSDYGLFRSMVHFFRGRRFETFGQVEAACREFFESKEPHWYRDQIRQLAERWLDSFQSTLDYDGKNDNQSNTENNNDEERIVKNLTQLTEEYCDDRKVNKESDDISMYDREEHRNEIDNPSKDYRQKQNSLPIENIVKQYFMLMESLEFRMERHEQLTKLAQKSIKLTLIEQESRKINMKK
ncbi:unnamed protein product [Rotaria magnacalcarata]|uniref:Ion transport domain-containing protein n=2 Tax=Rotaria magnacalcarata TaxID=392030 RepID=A0A814XQ89_9BILA|nr:unnamed protein product [Rotaria magnacalcarata]